MKKLESTIIIQRPIEDVFETVTDMDRFPVWRTDLIQAMLTSDGPVQVGSTYQFDMKVMGREIETTGEIKAYEAPNLYAWKALKSPFSMSGSTLCEPVPEGTKVTETIEVDPGGFYKLAEGLLARQQKAQMMRDLEQLKAMLENGVG